MSEFRRPYKLFPFVLLFLWFAVLLSIACGVEAQRDTLTDACDLGTAVTLRVIDWTTGERFDTTDAATIAALGTWAGISTWNVVTEDFDTPPDEDFHWEIQVTLADGARRWVFVNEAESTPETVYVYGYYSLRRWADANGEHDGLHDFCAAGWAVDAAAARAWLE